MKVLHVASWYPARPEDIAGVFVREHIRCLVGHVEQLVAVPAVDGDDSTRSEGGVAVSRPRLHYAAGTWLAPYANAVLRQARAYRPDLVHAHVARPGGVGGAWAARVLGIPYLLTEHTGPFTALFETHALNRFAARWALRGASTVTAVTESQGAEIERLVPGVKPVIVPNTVDVSRFGPRREGKRGSVRFLFVGRLVRVKGCHVLLQALARPEMVAGDWSLAIVGAGPEEPALRDLARPLGERVRFLGHQPPSRVPAFMADADVLVLPSLQESFGVVVIEALAAGVPVLATRCGGPDDLVTEEEGRLVPADDPAALGAGLAWMREHHEEFPRETLRGRAISRFGFERVAGRFMELYQSATSGRLGERS